MKKLLRAVSGLLAALLLAAPLAPAHAQAPAWAQVATGTHPTGMGAIASIITAVATDDSGNVFVTGHFIGTLTFGGAVLTSKGSYEDIFIAKYVPATGTWAWAQRGGGNLPDASFGLAVRGNSVYLTGTVDSGFTPRAAAITFGGTTDANSPVPLAGLSSLDIVVAKYTDNGTSGTCNWVQALGNSLNDDGAAIAVSGTSLYVAGNSGGQWYFTKLTDTGTAATQAWAYTGGGNGPNLCTGLAVSGANIYLTGQVTNNAANANAVTFGSGGTPGGVAVAGASATASTDLVLLKYIDRGATATLQWAQVAGGTRADGGRGVAVRGTSVYVTGFITNDTNNTCGVGLGGPTPQLGATPLPSADWLLAKYTDNGLSASLGWAQVAGGDQSEGSYGLAVSGTSVYVTGYLYGGTSNAYPPVFGGSGTSMGTQQLLGYGIGNKDLVVAKYTDNGPTATVQWAQVGGGQQSDLGQGIAVSGQRIYAGGSIIPAASFGTLAIATPAGYGVNVLASLLDADLTPLAAAPAAAVGSAALYPNPAQGLVTLSGVAPGAAVRVLDALGRAVLASTADAGGTARLALPAGLAPGVYVVRSGAQALRLAVE